MHNLLHKTNKNKQKQSRQNEQRKSNVIISPLHEKVKETAPQNAQKQEKNTTEPKARNKAAKTASLFRDTKIKQTPKKQKKNTKHQRKIILNEKCAQCKPEKPQRAPGRQNSAVRQAKRLPRTSPTGQQFFFGFNLKKKMNQSAF